MDRATQSQTEGSLIKAQVQALIQMQQQGIVPKHQILDSQCSAQMKLAMEATKLEDGSILKLRNKLVLPEEHWRNMAEKAIQTFKDHFVGVLSGCAKSMPMHLWCQALAPS